MSRNWGPTNDRARGMEVRTEVLIEALRLEQGGLCACCRQVDKLEVEHDPRTKLIRGLACHSCNDGPIKVADGLWDITASFNIRPRSSVFLVAAAQAYITNPPRMRLLRGAA